MQPPVIYDIFVSLSGCLVRVGQCPVEGVGTRDAGGRLSRYSVLIVYSASALWPRRGGALYLSPPGAFLSEKDVEDPASTLTFGVPLSCLSCSEYNARICRGDPRVRCRSCCYVSCSFVHCLCVFVSSVWLAWN
jgi:hypothetical protein